MTLHLTDERLKSHLDANQLGRERLALAVLALDRRYQQLRPRHPRGGPDGGRDIEGRFEERDLVYGAVGFVNQANDSREHRAQAAAKFRSDLGSALEADPKPSAFVFLTNVNLPQAEKDRLVAETLGHGLAHAEIFDRERMRILLDSPEGLAARFQQLGLTLTDAEQAAFFARWGTDLQSLITAGFGRLESLVRRLQFLHEAEAVLEHLRVILKLDREYSSEELGHARAFVSLFLRNASGGLLQIRFGTTDNTSRNKAKTLADLDPILAGVHRGMIGAEWEHRLPRAMLAEAEAELFGEHDAADDAPVDPEAGDPTDIDEKWRRSGSMIARGHDRVSSLVLSYSQDDFIRLVSRLRLAELDGAMFVVFLNASLADKVSEMHVFANAYRTGTWRKSQLMVDRSQADPEIDLVFTETELSDRWARLRPSNQSAFDFRFDEETPTRRYMPHEIDEPTD